MPFHMLVWIIQLLPLIEDTEELRTSDMCIINTQKKLKSFGLKEDKEHLQTRKKKKEH